MIVDVLNPMYGVTIKNSIEFYGKENQLNVCMEELAELISAISNWNINNIVEELADVYICISILQEIYDIPDKKITCCSTSEKIDIVILADTIKKISKVRRYGESKLDDLIKSLQDLYSLIIYFYKYVFCTDSYVHDVIGEKVYRNQRRIDEAIANNIKYTDINKEESK